MADSIIFRKRNPIILVSSSTNPSEERHKYKNTQLTEGNEVSEEAIVRKALYRVTRIPTWISHIIGINIFSYDSTSNEISCSVCSFQSLLSLFRLLLGIFMFHNYFKNRLIYKKIFGNWGATEEFSHGLSIITILICDTLSVLLTYVDLSAVTNSHRKLVRFVVDVTVTAEGTHASQQIHIFLARLKISQRWIEGMILLIAFFFVVAYASAIRNAFTVALILPETKDNMVILVTLPILIFYFIGVQILRQMAFYGPIGVISILTVCIVNLKDLIERVINRCKHLPQKKVEENVNQLLEHFRTLYQLVDEVNMQHQWTLITGVISLLIIIICSSFQLCVGLREAGAYTFIGTFCTVLSNCLTFYSLCAVSSHLTLQTIQCMVAMRDFVGEDATEGWDGNDKNGIIKISKALKQKLQMWHMEVTVQPPTISPGYYFTLKRSIIPPVI